jgi:hypothetical protein
MEWHIGQRATFGRVTALPERRRSRLTKRQSISQSSACLETRDSEVRQTHFYASDSQLRAMIQAQEVALPLTDAHELKDEAVRQAIERGHREAGAA